jgi:PPM family protein phosphatase
VKSEDIMTEFPVFAFGLTDVGGRKTNEDAFHMAEQHEASKLANRGRLYVVADGTGGQEGGRTASAWAAEVVAENYYDNASDDIGEGLRTAIQSAHRALFRLADEVPSWRSMSTTLVAVVVKGHEYWVAHVGDSRLYLIRGDKIQQITQDHTWQEDDDNFGSLTRWLGGGDQPTVEVDIHHDTLKEGDVLLLCTDGLYSQISKDDMRDLTRRMNVKSAVQQMISIAKTHGTTDNTTAIAVRVGGSAVEAAKIPRPMIFVGAGIAALILLVALISTGVIFPPRATPTPTSTRVVLTPTQGTPENTATPTVENTPAPGTPTSTLRPTNTPTATWTPRPIPSNTPMPTIGVVTQPTMAPTSQCPAGKFWDPIMGKCKGTAGGGDGQPRDGQPR